MHAILRITLLAACLLIPTGCKTPTSSESSTLLDLTGPITIDVESFGGDVFITGIEGADRATVYFERVALHGKGREDEAANSLSQIETSAEIVPGEIGQVLRVRATTVHAEPHFQRVHIHIEAPIVDGVTVLTRRGKVYVQNVSGAVDIETTFGNVRLMTAQPMTRAVTITNQDGDIDYRIRGESRGTFDCEALDGIVLHRVRLGTMSILSGTDQDSLQATLNGGDNPIVLRTVNGDIRIAVVEDPEAVGLRIFEP